MSVKALIMDRDNVINHASRDPDSPFYYITREADLILKPTVREAFNVLDALQRADRLKVYLATKQRCIAKQLATRSKVDDINREIERRLGFVFDGIYVEEMWPDKRHLYTAILKDSGLKPHQAFVIDDSPVETSAANAIGIQSYQMAASSELYHVVTSFVS